MKKTAKREKKDSYIDGFRKDVKEGRVEPSLNSPLDFFVYTDIKKLRSLYPIVGLKEKNL
ncbi:MAG: hypothetical protein KKC53_04005 [Actinobacteria bacterium]|nr:hypothetical protein [Actinomycetota bacterium]